jgi:NAD(P)-dependent dehydrogenase (short-subunit alcohol dehydrogenase family)
MTSNVPDTSVPKRIVILGALSAIAEQAARLWAGERAHLVLAGRDAARLDAVAADLRLRGASIHVVAANLAADGAERDLAAMAEQLGGVDIVLLAYGVLGEHKVMEADRAAARRLLETDFVSAAAWCLEAAELLERQRHGTLIVIGSVAGDRGRASNYIYGAAKGGLGILVQGIAHRLARHGARAILIKPGLVDTPMTASFGDKGLLWSNPETIAAAIVRAGDGGLLPVRYAPWFWRWIMAVIRFVPAYIFHRSSL